MRLAQLCPGWVTRNGRIIGMRMMCPCCMSCTLAVLFENPPDGGPPAEDDCDVLGNNNGRRWHRTGDAVDTLTLTPSIDVSSEGHWHGFVREGSVVTVIL